MELLFYKTCRICNIKKPRNQTSSNRTFSEFPVDASKIWKGNTCHDCNQDKVVRRLKKLEAATPNRLKLSVGEKEQKCCTGCNQTTTRTYLGKDKFNHGIYIAEDGRHWHGRLCPDCNATRERVRHSKRPKKTRPVLTKTCIQCSSEFKTQYSNTMVCSDSCRVMLHRARNPKKERAPRVKKAKVRRPKIKKTCPTCSCEFEGRPTKVYCKPSHSPSTIPGRKRAKVIRKASFKQKISKPYSDELVAIYSNKGNYEVDHIIPQRHPDVCGLHVPWNLQYLDSDTNQAKSNKWDGTMKNLNWRKS